MLRGDLAAECLDGGLSLLHLVGGLGHLGLQGGAPVHEVGDEAVRVGVLRGEGARRLGERLLGRLHVGDHGGAEVGVRCEARRSRLHLLPFSVGERR